MTPVMFDFDISLPPPPPPPPPPPKPKPADLEKATAQQANEAVQKMSKQDIQDFHREIDKLPVTQRQTVAKNLVGKLDAQNLLKLSDGFDADTIDKTVDTFGSTQLKSDYTLAKTMQAPGVKMALDKLGLQPEDIVHAGQTTLTQLETVAKAPNLQAALEALQHAGKADGALVQKAFQHLVQTSQLSGIAKTILTDPKVAAAALDATPATIDALCKGDVTGAIKGLAGNQPLRDAVIDAAVKDPGFKNKLVKLGLDPNDPGKDLKQAGDAAPALLNAADLASKGQWKEAALALAGAAKQAPEIVAKGIKAAAGHLPEPAASILGDDTVAGELAKSSPDALTSFINGNIGQGIHALADNKNLRDAVIDAAMKNPDFAGKVGSLGLNATLLKQAGDAVPSLLDAAQALSRNDWNTALKDMSQAGKAVPVVLKAVGEKIYAKMPPTVQAKLKGLGITEAQIQDGAAALPHLLDAANAIAAGHWSDALNAVFAAGETAPNLAQATLKKLGSDIPPGKAELVKQLLANDTVVKELASSPDLHAAILKMTSDNTLLEGASELLHNDSMRDAVLDVVAKDPKIATVLKKVGLDDPAQLKQAGAAAPHLLDAAIALGQQPPQWQQAVTALRAAGDAAPDLVKRAAAKIYQALPTNLQDKLKSLGIDGAKVEQIGAALPDLVDAAQSILSGHWPDAIDSVLKAGEAAPDLATDLIKNLGNHLPDDPKFATVRKLLTNDTVARGLATDQDLHDSINMLLDGKVLEGASKLLHNDNVRNAVLEIVGQDPQVAAALKKVGLDTPAKIQEAGAAIPYLLDAGIAITHNQWPQAVDDLGKAGTASPSILNAVSNALVAQMPDSFKNKLDELGLTTDDLKDVGAALPHVINAINQLGQQHYVQALQEIGQTMEAAPDLATKAIVALAKKIPESPKTQLLRSMLTDPDLVKTLVSDKSLHASVAELFDPDTLTEGLKGIANDTTAMSAVAKVLVKDPALMKRLAPLGIKTADDIVEMGPALGDALDLGDAIGQGKISVSIQAFAQLAKDLPTDTRDLVISKLTDTVLGKLHVSPALKELLSGSLEAMADPKVSAAIGDAIEAFGSGNPVAFIKSLAEAGKAMPNDLKVGFLDSLSHLPGSVGAFFSNHSLNVGIVQSGAMNHFFNAVEKLAGGDMAGALDELGDAITSLIGYGKKIQLGPYHVGVHVPFVGFVGHTFGPYHLPLSEEGLKLIGSMMTQFEKAMPPSVKTFIEEKASKAVASGGLKSIPEIGPAIGLAESGVSLAEDISGHKGGITIALDVANIVVNGAGLIPGASEITGPLTTLLGVAQAVNSTVSFVHGIDNFGQQFTGMAA